MLKILRLYLHQLCLGIKGFFLSLNLQFHNIYTNVFIFIIRKKKEKEKPMSQSKMQAKIEKDKKRQEKIAEILQVMIETQAVLWMVPIDLQEQIDVATQQVEVSFLFLFSFPFSF